MLNPTLLCYLLYPPNPSPLSTITNPILLRYLLFISQPNLTPLSTMYIPTQPYSAIHYVYPNPTLLR